MRTCKYLRIEVNEILTTHIVLQCSKGGGHKTEVKGGDSGRGPSFCSLAAVLLTNNTASESTKVRYA